MTTTDQRSSDRLEVVIATIPSGLRLAGEAHLLKLRLYVRVAAISSRPR